MLLHIKYWIQDPHEYKSHGNILYNSTTISVIYVRIFPKRLALLEV